MTNITIWDPLERVIEGVEEIVKMCKKKSNIRYGYNSWRNNRMGGHVDFTCYSG